MPIYEFECTSCGTRFDRLQKLADPDPESCPECGRRTVKRRLTAPTFRLSGSGWYETDFKKDGDKKRNLADKAEAKAESKTDAPAEKPKSTEKKAEPAKSAEKKPAKEKKAPKAAE